MSAARLGHVSRAGTALTLATVAFLLVAPFAGAAGWRAAMLLIAAAATVALIARGERPRVDSLPRAAIVAFAAWALVAAASLAWSVDRTYTFHELRHEVLYGALAAAAFYVGALDPGRWPAWRNALLAGALLVAAVHFVQPLLPFRLSRHGVTGQAGLWSTYLVLVAPFVLALGGPPPWGWGRTPLLAGVALLLLFAVAWGTGNRMVWPALGVQVMLAFALAAPTTVGDRARSVRVLAFAAAVVVAAVFVASVTDRGAVANAGASIPDTLASDARPRIWALAWERFNDAPWLGHGLGREILAPAFVPATPSIPGHPPVTHAHNLFIDMALQLGIPGLVAFVAILAALAVEYRSFLRDSRIAPLGVLGLALLAGFVVKNLTDDFLHRHNALVFWALNGALLGLGRSAVARGGR